MNKFQNIEKIRHSLAHLLAMAVLEKFPKAKLGIGPTIENGFYYDFALPAEALAKEGLTDLEKQMRELIKQDLKFKKETVSPAEAKKIFQKQPYKLELIKELNEAKEKISIYETLDPRKSASNLRESAFIDLCAGPHIKSTKEINPDAFKLTRIAGAYWKGSEKNLMLTRIYGVSFETKKELDDYLKLQEEIEKRDHRILGEKLDLFMIDEKIGKGLPLWLPKGYFIRHLLEEYIYAVEKDNGYLHVITPILAKENLYKTSGHLAHYKEDMYAPIEIEGEKYYLRPMNCPHHHSIYKHQIRSHKDLPLRIAEFGNVYRYERSGVLSGLIRVRGFTQNDAHIYTTPEKLEEEIANILNIHKKVYDDFDISNYWFRLSLPDFSAQGGSASGGKNKGKFGDIKNKKMWEEGADALRKTLNKLNLKFVEAVGEASFYGPKIDVQIKNIHGKEESIATIQVDYYSAPKFELAYIDKDGKEKPPVIIHRAIFGSFERFFAFLLEKTSGELPVWLSPIQTKIIPISEKHEDYGRRVLKELKNNNIRAEISVTNETLGKRIRNAELQKIPYILIVGEKEIQNKTVNVRHYRRGQEGEIKIEKLIEKIGKEIENKTI